MPVLESSQPHLDVGFNSSHDNGILSYVHISFYSYTCSLIKHLFVPANEVINASGGILYELWEQMNKFIPS